MAQRFHDFAYKIYLYIFPRTPLSLTLITRVVCIYIYYLSYKKLYKIKQLVIGLKLKIKRNPLELIFLYDFEPI